MDSKSQKGIGGEISEDVLNEELESKVMDFYNDVHKIWEKYSFLLERMDEIAIMSDKIQEKYNEAFPVSG